MTDAINRAAHNPSVSQSRLTGENGGFSLPANSNIAQADQPSAAQRERACLSMLNEARRSVDNLHLTLSSLTSAGRENFRKDPDSMAVLTERITEASAKLATVREQCGDVLPARAMKEVEELEKKLDDVRDLLFDDGVSPAVLLDRAGRMLQSIGEGLGALAVGVMLLLRQILGPGLPQSHRGSGRREQA